MTDNTGPAVAALIERAARLTREETEALAAKADSWDANALDEAEDAADYAEYQACRLVVVEAYNKALDTVGNAAGHAAGHAAAALSVKDLVGLYYGDRFTQEHFNTLTRPWREVIRDTEHLFR